MKERFTKKDMLGMSIILLIVLLILYAIFSFIGIGLLAFLGFEYESIGTVLLFFALYFLLSIPIDLFATATINSIAFIKGLSKKGYEVLYFLKDLVVSISLLSILDTFFSTISIPPFTLLLFAILSYCLEKLSPLGNKK